MTMGKWINQRVQAGILVGVIVLPQANRAEILDEAITRGRSIESVYIVAAAAERAAESRDGLYSPNVASFYRFLPGGMPLMNGATAYRTEPVDGMAAAPGAIGYVPIAMGYYNVGYTISAFGRDATVGVYGDGILIMLQKITDPPAPEQP